MPLFNLFGLREKLRAILAVTSLDSFVTSRTHNRSREMWVAERFASGFAKAVGACEVQIEETDEQREFDFHLVVDGRAHPFQITEVLDAGRKRGDEYKLISREERVAMYSSEEGGDASYAAEQIAGALNAKLAKYGDGSTLHVVLYLNLRAGSVSCSAIVQTCGELAVRFASVWVITDGMLCCLNSGGFKNPGVTWRRIDSPRLPA